MTGFNNSMNSLIDSIVDAIPQLSARFDSVANDLRSEFANGLRSVTADASRTAPRFLGIHTRPASIGDAISEMDSPSAIMQQHPQIDVTSNATSHLTAIQPIMSTVSIHFVQSNLVQVIENQSRNIDSTVDTRFLKSLKKECRSIEPIDYNVQWLRVPSTVVIDSQALTKDPQSIPASRAMRWR